MTAPLIPLDPLQPSACDSDLFAASLGALIVGLRNSHHPSVTQMELALTSGVSQPTLSRLERGERIPDGLMLLALARALDRPLGTLLSWSKRIHDMAYLQSTQTIPDVPWPVLRARLGLQGLGAAATFATTLFLQTTLSTDDKDNPHADDQ